ncbi:MAG: hypothetical protein H7Y88_05025 [Phycisphaerales bacterium]|nr:hypothetical protein [Phycisphaerales bacterium]
MLSVCRVWSVASAMVLATSAAAQPRFILPVIDPVKPGEAIRLRIEDEHAKSCDWPAHEAAWVFTRSVGKQQNAQRPEADKDQPGWTVMEAQRPGLVCVGVDFEERTAMMTPGELIEIADRGGATDAAAALGKLDAKKAITVRRVDSARGVVLVRNGPDAAPAATAAVTSKTGQAVEIRPLLDPVHAPLQTDVMLRLYVLGSSVAGAVLTGTNLDTGESVRLAADASGIVTLRVINAGRWRVWMEHVRLERGEDGGATWTVYTGSLAFTSRAEVAKP